MTQADLVEVYSVRSALEVRAVHDGIENATEVELRGIAQAFKLMDAAWCTVRSSDWDNSTWMAAVTADKAFHRSVIRLAKNSRMDTIYDQMTAQTLLLLLTAAETDRSLHLAPLGDVHRSIARAISRRDAKAASLAIEEHYDYTRSRLFATAATDQELPRNKNGRARRR
jgi:DNA-binding GntR family transcriptional regulator